MNQKNLTNFMAIVVAVLALALFVPSGFFSKSQATEKEEVFQAINQCLEAEKKNACFKVLSQEFIEHGELETVFALLEEKQQAPGIFESCHVLLHFVGQAAYKKFQDISATLKSGNYVCFAGFYHGALEGYFIENNLLASADGGLAALKERVPQICTETESEAKKDYLECLHGLGHGLMFATDGEVPQALELCDALGETAQAEWCYSGVFMENSTSTTNPDHPSKYLKADDPAYPCTILDGKYAKSCYILQSMRVTHDTRGNWSEVANFCLKVPAVNRGPCFNGIGQSLVGFTTDPQVVRDQCLCLPSAYQDVCIMGAVGAAGEKYKPPLPRILELCAVFAEKERGQCYTASFHSMNNWTKNQRELFDFCDSILDKNLSQTCREFVN